MKKVLCMKYKDCLSNLIEFSKKEELLSNIEKDFT
jgi:hypothetical protein